MEKSRTLGTNMIFTCYLLLKEAYIHINLICFDGNFDHPLISVVTSVPRKQSKSDNFSTEAVFVKEVFDMYLLLGLFSRFSQNSHAILKNYFLNVVPLKN